MQIGTVLDVAIGVAFVFFLLAVIASFLQELMAGVFRWRGTYLVKAMDVLLDNAPGAQFGWKSVGDWVASHLGTGPATALRTKPPADPIMARVTVATLDHPLLRGVPNLLPSRVSPGAFATALLDALRDGSALPAFSQVEATVASLPDGDLKTTLGCFVRDAGGDLDRLRASIEAWFDAAMDRLSGIYTRFSSYVLMAIGVVLAVGLNVDALRIARTLYDEPASRAVLVAHAGTASLPGPATDLSQQLGATLDALRSQPIPLGWQGGFDAHAIVGWVITALAISLGAPFWFNLLQTIGGKGK